MPELDYIHTTLLKCQNLKIPGIEWRISGNGDKIVAFASKVDGCPERVKAIQLVVMGDTPAEAIEYAQGKGIRDASFTPEILTQRGGQLFRLATKIQSNPEILKSAPQIEMPVPVVLEPIAVDREQVLQACQSLNIPGVGWAISADDNENIYAYSTGSPENVKAIQSVMIGYEPSEAIESARGKGINVAKFNPEKLVNMNANLEALAKIAPQVEEKKIVHSEEDVQQHAPVVKVDIHIMLSACRVLKIPGVKWRLSSDQDMIVAEVAEQNGSPENVKAIQNIILGDLPIDAYENSKGCGISKAKFKPEAIDAKGNELTALAKIIPPTIATPVIPAEAMKIEEDLPLVLNMRLLLQACQNLKIPGVKWKTTPEQDMIIAEVTEQKGSPENVKAIHYVTLGDDAPTAYYASRGNGVSSVRLNPFTINQRGEELRYLSQITKSEAMQRAVMNGTDFASILGMEAKTCGKPVRFPT